MWAMTPGLTWKVMHRIKRKWYHLGKLASGNKRTVRFRDHKDAIEGQTTDICQSMCKTNAAHRFNRMNKKPD